MEQNPLMEVTERLKQAQLEKELQELTAELKKVNERLTEIEGLLKNPDTPTGQTYIK